jgi:hypothetical protein
VPADGVERRAQLVAHRAQELALRSVARLRAAPRLLGLGARPLRQRLRGRRRRVEPRVLERERGAARDLLGEPEVRLARSGARVGGEEPLAPRARAARHERHGDVGGEPTARQGAAARGRGRLDHRGRRGPPASAPRSRCGAPPALPIGSFERDREARRQRSALAMRSARVCATAAGGSPCALGGRLQEVHRAPVGKAGTAADQRRERVSTSSEPASAPEASKESLSGRSGEVPPTPQSPLRGARRRLLGAPRRFTARASLAPRRSRGHSRSRPPRPVRSKHTQQRPPPLFRRVWSENLLR